MKNKSKLILFAAVVLQALLLTMPVSAFATAADDQEIGVPQAMEAPVKGCFGAVLSPDGEHFYTVREGLLTQYKINPFKKIGSVAIDWEPLKDRPSEPRCRVLITNDKSKLIIVYYDKMFLLDASTGKILNKFERSELGRAFSYAVLNENELVMLDTYLSEDAYFHNLTIWDANTLKFKKEIHDLGKSFGFAASQDGHPGLSKIQDRIYMTTGRSLAVLNSKTYMPELTLAIRPDPNLPSFGMPKISKNFQKLYVGKVSEVTDHLNGKHASYGESKFSSVLVFDNKTREFRIENINNISREELDPFLVHPRQLSRNKGYVMVSDGSSQAYAFLVNLNSDVWFPFNRTGVLIRSYQYEFGEAILLGSDKYFLFTPGARKYLMMKNSTGKIVPINDATFTKYLRTE
jgi:hypothetical protein